MSGRDPGQSRRRGRGPKAATLDGVDYETRESALEAVVHASSPSFAEPEEGTEESPVAPDSVLARARDRLASAKGVDADRVRVDIERGIVILSGSVRTDAMRQRVVDIVGASGGVSVIRNRIRLAG